MGDHGRKLVRCQVVTHTRIPFAVCATAFVVLVVLVSIAIAVVVLAFEFVRVVIAGIGAAILPVDALIRYGLVLVFEDERRSGGTRSTEAPDRGIAGDSWGSES